MVEFWVPVECNTADLCLKLTRMTGVASTTTILDQLTILLEQQALSNAYWRGQGLLSLIERYRLKPAIEVFDGAIVLGMCLWEEDEMDAQA